MIVIECDDVIALCLAPSTERFLHSDDDHESEVGQDPQAAQAGEEDGGYSLLLSNRVLRINYPERGSQDSSISSF